MTVKTVMRMMVMIMVANTKELLCTMNCFKHFHILTHLNFIKKLISNSVTPNEETEAQSV